MAATYQCLLSTVCTVGPNLIKEWLRLFRAQTLPATLLGVLVPYLMGTPINWTTLIIILFCIPAHFFAFGENSLMDAAAGYDQRDPSKQHHPLVTGAISLTAAHNVVHWGLLGAIMLGILITLVYSPNPVAALICLTLWVACGHTYNAGLSKESWLGFIPIALACTASVMWGWFLSHQGISCEAFFLFLYCFLMVAWQTAYAGHLKDLLQGERSNVLLKLGMRLENGGLHGGKAKWFGMILKVAQLLAAFLLLLVLFTPAKLVWYVLLSGVALLLTYKLVKDREWDRKRDMLRMSLEEAAVILLPVPLVLSWGVAVVLVVGSLVYFFAVNRLVWGRVYPAI